MDAIIFSVRQTMLGSSASTHAENDALLLAALARAVEIGASINRLGPADPAGVQATLRLIVESAIAIAPDVSAVIYTYDARRRAFDPASRVAAGERADASVDDFPRPAGLGVRAVGQLRPVLSYEEPDLAIHPAKTAAGAQVVACLPLVVAEQAVGALYVYRRQARPFTQLELLLLHNFVNQAAMAISHAGRLAGVQADLARKEEELRRLRHAGLLISSRTRLDETLEAILQMALEVTGARYGILRLADKGGQNLIAAAIVGERLGRPAIEALPLNATSIMGYVGVTRQPLCIPDVRVPPWSRIYYPLDRALEMRAELAVPLIGASGRLIGVLNLESPAVGAFSEADSHLLQSLATQAVIAIQEVRLLDALQETAERLLTQPAQQVLEHLVALACELLGGSASAIWLLSDETLTLAAASAGHVRGDRLTLHESLTGQAILTRGCVTCADVRAEPRFGWPHLAQAQGWTRALIVPLLSASDREPVGAFSVYGAANDEGRFAASDWDKKILGILAHYAALAVRNAESQAALQTAQEQRATAETFAAVGDIAANLLHRLNNKVGAIPVRVEGIEDKCAAALAVDPYLAANLHQIGQSGREAMEAVRYSLAHLQPMPLAPVGVAQCVADALASSHLPPGVQVEVVGLADLPPVSAHARGLTFVFNNLLENAAEAMGERGKVEIRGSTRRGWVEVSVSDSGPGIPPELRSRIFELNFSGPRRARPDKLGFGLWWVRTLMTRLGGTIAVESDGRHGASFRLRLPTS
jgi:signal transduction histidine kinase